MANDYGHRHRELRTYWAGVVGAGNNPPCSRCGYPVFKTDKWDLDHTDDGNGYQGPAHADCNRRAGAVKRNRLYRRNNRTRTPKPPNTRNW